MENFLKQLRVRLIREESQDDANYTREGRIPQQKTVSFKGERKKAQGWFQRQFSGQMNDMDDSLDGDFQTAVAVAVAAAAFAVTALKEKEEGSLNQKRLDGELRRSLTKTKSKKEESTDKPTDYRKISRWFSGKDAKEDGRPPVSGESSMIKSATLDQRLLEDSTADRKEPEKAMATTPTIKKTPTFSDKYLNDPGSKRFEPGPRTAPAIKPTASSYSNGKPDAHPIGSKKVGVEADSWEEAKMAKIKKRYEKLISTILEWESEKRTKAKRRMERKEREIEQRRAIVMQEYRNEMARIDKIAGGARAQADERMRNDESKTIEKAKVLRSTGKLPNKCRCF